MSINSEYVIKEILDGVYAKKSRNMREQGIAYAPSNIALVKYWGKSNTAINIPYTDSLSISLGDLGATTKIVICDKKDVVYLNNQLVEEDTDFFQRIRRFLNLFRNYEYQNTKPCNYDFRIDTTVNIPIAAGVASSACGFAALVLSLNDLFDWQLDEKALSILARLGSGSAARSLWQGFVYWQKGSRSDGMDSYAYKYEEKFKDLAIGLIIISTTEKAISSRKAMEITAKTSVLYKHAWSRQVTQDLTLIKQAIAANDISLLGQTAENNALAMHATMMASNPSIIYSTEETLKAIQKIWHLRSRGVEIYFTQDAGPNLKLIFDKKITDAVKSEFPEVCIVV